MKLPPTPFTSPRVARFVFTILVALAVSATAVRAAEAAEEQERKIYAFEHRTLPKWTHGSDGAFYTDLASGHAEQLIAKANEFLGTDFGAAIRLRVLQEPEAVLITFPAPTKPPHCFFAAVVKTKDGFRYVTAEKTEDLMGEGLKAVLGEWTADGAHRLLDFSKDSSEEWFVQRLGQLVSAAPAEKPAGKGK